MASIASQRYPINQNTPFVDKNGKLTAEGFRIMRAISDFIGSITIANGEVGTPELADSAATTAKIADGSITPPKIAGGAVTEPKIALGAVTTNKLAAQAVTAPVSSAGVDITVTFLDGETEIHTQDITIAEGEVVAWFSAQASSTDVATPDTTYRFKVDGVTVQSKEWAVGSGAGARDVMFQFVSQPAPGLHTYSVTCELAGITSVLHQNVEIQLRNYKR